MRITVRVTPRAAAERFRRTSGDSYDIAVHDPPVGGKATEAVRRVLAAHFGIARSRIRLLMGQASRVKVFEIL